MRSLVAMMAACVLVAGIGGIAAAQPAQKPGGKTASPPGAKPAEPGEGTPPPGEGETAKVEGFRSANFGGTETQVRAAIRKDFNLANDKITVEEHPVERTTMLAVTVSDLLPETGPARISYILGYKSKKLMQVHIVWAGGPGGAKPEKLLLAANTLLQYFLGEGFARDKVVVNGRANDGSIVVFQGSDAQKRTTLLRLVTAPGEGDEKDKEKPVALFLSYVQDIQNPDVFRISKGQF
jgi:hypothetical protein